MKHRLFFSSFLSFFFFFGIAVPLKTKYSRWNLPYKLAPKMKICNTLNCRLCKPPPPVIRRDSWAWRFNCMLWHFDDHVWRVYWSQYWLLESIRRMGGNFPVFFVQKSKQTEMPNASNRGCKGCSYWGYSQMICFPSGEVAKDVEG